MAHPRTPPSDATADPDLSDLYRTAFECTPTGMAFLSLERKVIRANPALCHILGYSESELMSRGVNALTHSDDLGFHVGVHQDLLAGLRTSYELEKRYLHADGHVVWATLEVGVINGPDGAPIMLVSQVHDVTERVNRDHQTAWRADHDPLTAAMNRAALFRELDRTVSAAATKPAAIIFLDLDGFKQLNDTLGHGSGDRFLVRVVERLEQVLRDTDAVARIGGDEFVLVAHDVPDSESAIAVGEAVRSAIKHLAAEMFPASRLSASIGVALTPAISADDLLRRADAAMYRAKRAGGDQAVLDDNQAPHGSRLSCRDDL